MAKLGLQGKAVLHAGQTLVRISQEPQTMLQEVAHRDTRVLAELQRMQAMQVGLVDRDRLLQLAARGLEISNPERRLPHGTARRQ